MIEHLLVYKSKTQYNLKIYNIFLTNKHKFKMQQLFLVNHNLLWDEITQLNDNLFTLIQDVKENPLDLPATGFIILGGTILLIILSAGLLG